MTLGQLARISGKSALVLSEFNISEEGPIYIHIKGRKKGFWSWLCARWGIDDTTTVDVYENKIAFGTGSLAGRVVETIPLSSVSNIGTGFVKPVLYAVLGIICLFGFAFVIPLLFAALFFYLFWTRKTLLVYITPNSGDTSCIAVKRSLIENISINQETADQVIAMLEKLIENQTKR